MEHRPNGTYRARMFHLAGVQCRARAGPSGAGVWNTSQMEHTEPVCSIWLGFSAARALVPVEHRGVEHKCVMGRTCSVNAFSMLSRPHAPVGESGFDAFRAGKCDMGRMCTANGFSMLFRPHAPVGESGFEALRARKCVMGRMCTANAFSMLFWPHAPDGESGFEALRARKCVM